MWADIIVLIPQSIQIPVGLIQDIPPRLLVDLAIGQQLEAVVAKAALAGELVTIKVGDSLLTIRTQESLQAGQRIQLELILENGKPVLKFVSSQSGQSTIPLIDTTTQLNNPNINTAVNSIKAGQHVNNLNINTAVNSIKVGQHVAVEVVKLLAENRVLVQTITSDNRSQVITKPEIQRFDIDVSQLSQRYKQGDKLTLEIVGIKPLTINLRPEQPPAREKIILERLQQLIRQQVDKPSLNTIAKAFHNQQVPAPVQSEVRQLLQHALDKPALTKSNAFKQALLSSGVFTEKQLLSQPIVIKQDFKANVLKLITVLETVIAQASQKGSDTTVVLNKLPAQVQAALATQGKTPTQLLNILLSGRSLSPGPQSSIAHTIPVITSQDQALLLAQLLNTTKPSIERAVTVTNRQVPIILSELQAMLREVEGVHSKLQFNQLSMLKEPESTNTLASWLFDVPIKDKQNLDLLQLQIDQHRQQSDDEMEDIWSVHIRLDTQNLGPVQATVTMHSDDIKIILRAERKQSAQLLEDNLTLLDAALSKLGVSISHMNCYCGEISKPVLMENDLVQSNSLVDVSV
ncbi:MAG: flagellar hook-length control protein FliK [Piscirickettsiaceae bacterium]|nr:flagellar hook-length control protein FliK [Piscirickettsiaceae bacterium]